MLKVVLTNGERERATRDNGGGKLATKGPNKGKRKEGGTGKDRLGEK